MDDRLRALDRAVRGAPADPDVAWALIRALEQAGDDLGAWRARCRLARAGVDEAWLQLEELPRGVRRIGETKTIERPEGEVLRAANGGGVLVVGTSTQMWDPVTLEARWVVPESFTVATLCGPVALYGEGPRNLVVRATARDEVLARVPLPFTDTSRIEVSAGLALLDTGGARRRDTAVVDLLEPDPLARHHRFEVQARTMAATRGLRLLCGDRGRPRAQSLLARTIPDHEAHWSVPGHIFAHDSRHVVTRLDEEDRPVRLLAVSSKSGERAWERTLDTESIIDAEWTPDALVVAANIIECWHAPSTTLDVHALDRATGATRWRLRQEVGPHVVVRIAAARDVVVVAYGPPRPSPFDRSFQAVGDLTLCGIDLATGEILWTCAPAPRETSSLTSSFGLFALDRALLAWIVNDDGRYLVRLEDA